MASFQIISDIHIEKMYPNKIEIQTIIKPSAPYLIIAGDIGQYSKLKEYYEDFIVQLCSVFEKVYFIPGNHEYYSKEKTIYEIKFDFSQFKKKINNFIILDNKGLNIDNTNIRIYGTTLWSKIPDHYKSKRPILKEPSKQVNTTWFNLQHYKCLYMLEEDIDQYLHTKKIVIISHYPPLTNGVLREDQLTNPYRFYYSNNLKYIIGKKRIHTWISGHTHNNYDFFEKGTRFVSNQYRGYGYILDKIIDIE